LARTAVAVAAVLLNTTLDRASAATQVRGEQNDLQIMIQNASTKEVLDALGAKFNLTYKLPPGTGRDLTGHYSGALYQVLARILDGNDYFVEMSDGGIHVVILGASGTIATPAANQAFAVGENATAPISPSKPTVAVTPSTSNSSPPPLSTYLSANGSTIGPRTNNP